MSLGSRAPSLNSNCPSAVKTSMQFHSCAAPAAMPISNTPFHAPSDLNTSTESTTSSLTSSYQTREGSSALHFANYSHSLLLPHSKDGYGISTPDSNLMSHDIMGGGTVNLLTCYFFQAIFFRLRRNKLIRTMPTKYGPMQLTLIEASQRQILMTLRLNNF